jgi:hypothetical protein
VIAVDRKKVLVVAIMPHETQRAYRVALDCNLPPRFQSRLDDGVRRRRRME